ncbi:16S rRNA (guanine(527)-N(7))-methyltransferase RsmG [Mycoplasma struthionis]|uniref:Ribosomal RNA small subunit methyltransferase G n=1 Tax=Mycoplasma struthionis TaxID=538220 RepID=A0A502M7J4_9MOLU|nr:16S rRNA (guanine(527)-N(7))-methyltransferase RsmG [Mycoplasma struthionis]TPI01912.1 16S rRNA (guanine(527)-N(7))-methyltransferase RsmG [Mycoplasma struthionis]
MLTVNKFIDLIQTHLDIQDNQILNNLYKYYELVEIENQKYNLTGYRDEKLVNEGIIESILIFINIEKEILNLDNKKVLDIGSGAGFPIIPYKIYKPNLDITIYEPMQKRVNFLNMVINDLSLQNIIVKKIRAEESNEEYKFDFISAKAVSELKNLIEISFNLGKKNGVFCFLKSKNYQNEINNASKIINTFKIDTKIKKVINPFGYETNLIFYNKTINNLENYPRKWSFIIKDDLKKV